jgi:hypothetical protein
MPPISATDTDHAAIPEFQVEAGRKAGRPALQRARVETPATAALLRAK